jgi:hypothetical protein
MKKLRLTGVAGLAVIAALIPAADAAAKQTKAACPKSWQPVPTQATPPGKKDRDKNGNFQVCAKPAGGSGNPHINVKDDRTNQTVLPIFWTDMLIDSADPLQDIWITINNLDTAPNYFLDPAPEDYTDDVEVP